MKETNFIEQNKHKWKEFENELRTDQKDPEKLSELFVETTDDLSFARTYYANRSVRVYLNDIAQQAFQKIYKSKTSKDQNFRSFWTKNIPQALWENRKILLWAFLIFIGGFAIAIISSIHNEDFATIMMGSAYIEQTIENINNGDPMAIYGSWENPTEMFLAIASNNIRVCLIVFALGVFAGVGTVFMLFREAIRIGAFLFFFWERNLFEDAFFAVMLHGTIELSMIIISGMAGMVMAKGLIFPKSYSRLQSFIKSSRQGIMIMIGVIAFLLIAAFIEGYATRHTDVSNWIRGGVIFGSLAIVVSYFIFYPWLLYRSGSFKKKSEDELLPDRITSINFGEIKSSGTIFTELFYFFKKNFSKHLRTAFLGALSLSIILIFTFSGFTSYEAFLLDEGGSRYLSDVIPIIDIISPWNEVNNFFQLDKRPMLWPLYALLGTFITVQIFASISKEKDGKASRYTPWKYLQLFIIHLVFLFPFALSFQDEHSRSVILAGYSIFILPIFILTLTTSTLDQMNLAQSFTRMFALLKKNYLKFISTTFFIFSVPWILLISCNSYLWYLIYEVVMINVSVEAAWGLYIPYFIYSFFVFFVMIFSWPMYLYGMGLINNNLSEINEAGTLRTKIQNINFKKRIYGIEKEH